MKTSDVLTGEINSVGELVLNQASSLPPGPVRVVLEPLSVVNGAGAYGAVGVSDQDWVSRKARLDALAGTLSDEDAKEMLEIVEQEFGQVNLDDWR